MKPAVLEILAVFEAIIFPYALVFLCNFLMTRFIHFSGLLNPGKSFPPAIGLANNMIKKPRSIINFMI